MTSTSKILVLDDEAGIRLFLQETLTSDGHEVVAVESGQQALDLIAQQTFDLALLDLNLPGIGGMDVLPRLRQNAPDTVVIILTAHGSLETAVEALRQGAHDYLFKPCKTVQLRESIRKGLLKRRQELQKRAVLRKLEESLAFTLDSLRENIDEPPVPAVASPQFDEPPEDRGRFLRHGDLIVDFSRHVITLNEHLLELSPTEFDLLAYLVSEAPRTIAPKELVREVQGYESENWEASEIVRQHIRRIRLKIKMATGQTNVIQTVRGIGYAITT